MSESDRQLTRFQRATVDVAVKTLVGRGSRRFLVADEVGLGKTIVSIGVISRLLERHRKDHPGTPFKVMYVCSNLNIAAQNRDRLIEVLDDRGDRERSVCHVDRLPLLADVELPSKCPMRLFTITPNTSFPVRQGGSRSGNAAERALVALLVMRLWPRLYRRLERMDAKIWRAGVSPDNWTWRFGQLKRQLTKKSRPYRSLEKRFRSAIRHEFGLTGPLVISRFLETWVDEHEPREFVMRLRSALVHTALLRNKDVAADLVIMDEFQNYAALIKEIGQAGSAPPEMEGTSQAARRKCERLLSRHRLLGKMFGTGHGEGPALLLLSATPYRYQAPDQTQRGEDRSSDYNALLDLAFFLFGGNARASRKREELKQAFGEFREVLTRPRPSSGDRFLEDVVSEVAIPKSRIEQLLGRVMARTERAALLKEHDIFRLVKLSCEIRQPDLRVFHDLSTKVRERHPSQIHATVPYWMSIPYPAQTMGASYAVWDGLKDNPIGRKCPKIRHPARSFRSRNRPDVHPALRALQEQEVDTDFLTLPWIPPTLPWWRLGGVWRHRDGSNGNQIGKALLFSLYRATPPVVASLLSYGVEHAIVGGTKVASEKLTYRRVQSEPLLRASSSKPDPSLLALFFPWPWLVKSVDPRRGRGLSYPEVIEDAVVQIKASLEAAGVAVTRGKPRKSLWHVLLALESLVGRFGHHGGEIERAIRHSHDAAAIAALKGWRDMRFDLPSSLTSGDVRRLAQFAIENPAVVAARAIRRHWPEALEDGNLAKVFSLTWSALRPYLGHRVFAAALRQGRKERYTQIVQRAVGEGNLESVLDEQMAVLSRIYGRSGDEFLDELRSALRLHTGRLTVHNAGRKTFNLRSHAALPFTGTVTSGASVQKGKDGVEPTFRSDSIRKAFNSPFWPHVLCTTSIGQEGLDFHVWTDRMVHWDLPATPVEFEQREGRINRYGGLVVRREMADSIAATSVLESVADSPWEALFASVAKKANSVVNDKEPDLWPWWVPKDPKYALRRVVFDWPLSLRTEKLERLKQDLLFYRLALGQPNVDDFVRQLRATLGLAFDEHPELAGDLTINLSPIKKKA